MATPDTMTGNEPFLGSGRRAACLDPWRRAEALYRLAVEHLARRDLVQAMVSLRDALEECPEHAGAQWLLPLVEDSHRRQIAAYERRVWEEQWRRQHPFEPWATAAKALASMCGDFLSDLASRVIRPDA